MASTSPYFGDTVNVLLGNGDGTFQAPDVIPLDSGGSPVAIVAGNFTSNGILDLATADSNGGSADSYSVLLGNGDGTFQTPTAKTLGGAGGSSSAIAVGDFTGNGLSDLAIASTNPDGLQVRLSNGDGTFSDPSEVDLDAPPNPPCRRRERRRRPRCHRGRRRRRYPLPGRTSGRTRHLRTARHGQPRRPVARRCVRRDQSRAGPDQRRCRR